MQDKNGKEILAGASGSFSAIATSVAGSRVTTKMSDDLLGPFYNEIAQPAASPVAVGDSITIDATVTGFLGDGRLAAQMGDTRVISGPGHLFTLS